MLRYLQSCIDQLRWPRLKPIEKLARMLLDHLEGILNYCRTKVPLGSSKRPMATSRPYSGAAGDNAT